MQSNDSDQGFRVSRHLSHASIVTIFRLVLTVIGQCKQTFNFPVHHIIKRRVVKKKGTEHNSKITDYRNQRQLIYVVSVVQYATLHGTVTLFVTGNTSI